MRWRGGFMGGRSGIAVVLATLVGFGSAGVAEADPGFATPSGSSHGMSAMDSLSRSMVGMQSSSLAGRVDADQYLVGPGDVFMVHLSGRVSRTDYLTVGPEGTLLIPGMSPIPVDDLTLREAHTRLQSAIRAQFNGVQVDVSLAQVRNMKVYVVGEVNNPGSIDVPASSRLSDALDVRDMAPGASRRNIVITRTDGSTVDGDLELFERTGRRDANPYLRGGDVIRVRAATQFVEILGAVARPGRIELGATDSLRTLIDLAGGLLPSARTDRGLLVRLHEPGVPPESLAVPLTEIDRGAPTPKLQDGDHLFVYFVPRFHEFEQAAILGEVHAPGNYPLSPGRTRLSDLVRSAGGFLDRADSSAIRIYRSAIPRTGDKTEIDRLEKLGRTEMTDGEYGSLRATLAERSEDFRVDWTRLKTSPELDVVLRVGDVVTVDPIQASVRVEGEVLHPGLIRYAPGRPVEDYIRLAGGYSHRADANKVSVKSAVTGQTQLAHDNVFVSAGDLIWVPEFSDKTFWQMLATLTMVAAQVATVVIAVRH